VYRGTSADSINGIVSATTVTQPHEADVRPTECVGSICAVDESPETPGLLDAALHSEPDRGPSIYIDWEGSRAVVGSASERLYSGRLYLVTGAGLETSGAEGADGQPEGLVASPSSLRNPGADRAVAFRCYTESGWAPPVWPKPLLLCSPETASQTSHETQVPLHGETASQ
jgi:hypothetical protein